MTKFFDSPSVKNIVSKLLLIFTFYVVASASFQGFYSSYAFMDILDEKRTIDRMFDETAYRPFVYRQFMLQISREITNLMSEETKKNLIDRVTPNDFDEPCTEIEVHYGMAKIGEKIFIEYHILYFMCFGFIFLSMFLWREIAIEITGNKLVGTLTACCFALLFPLFEVRGVFYDCAELFFCALLAIFAYKGNWIGLIIVAPIAAYNKEATLFFVLTLYPFLTSKLPQKKAMLVTTISAFLCGLVYLYISAKYAGNLGGAVEFHFWDHVEWSSRFEKWIDIRMVYGTYWFSGFAIFNILLIALVFKRTWNKLPTIWRTHIKFLLMINVPLYIFLCGEDEIRNFSLLYVGFIAMLSIFIKEMIFIEQKN